MKITYLDGRPDETVEDPHFCVTICGYEDFVSRWNMTMDLTEMCDAVGKKTEWYDNQEVLHKSVTFSASTFKKALKLIIRHGSQDLVDQVQWWLDKNYPKWGKEFKKLSG